MEKKTIGDFIATLRKANGMTQKELAEHLNVSDKTVSRWERNEGAPDLSLIPVIAEIFNISCDELLRGERTPASERTDAPINIETTSPKAEKQRQRLLKASLSSFKTKSYIAMCISVVGLIIVLICNSVATQALLGFLIGVIFFAISIVYQKISINKAFLCVEDSELDETQLFYYKKNVYTQAEKSIGLTIFSIGFTLPLAFVDPYFGLDTALFIVTGTACGIIFSLIYAITKHFVNHSYVQKHVDILTEKQLIAYKHNRKLKQKCFGLIIILLTITVVLHIFGNENLWDPYSIASHYGIVFEDYDSFKEYMEQDIPPYKSGAQLQFVISPIIDDEYETNTNFDKINIIDSNDNVVCTFKWKNINVFSYDYTAKEDGALPITVITNTDYFAASDFSDVINLIYSALYPIELISILLFYSKKKMK